MAHFALVEDGIVTQVIVVDDEHAPDPAPDNEHLGQAYIASRGLEGHWLQTSYNHNFRKQYGPTGYSYDSVADVFIEPQPYPSWTLNANYDWQPPTPRPTDGGAYWWDEASLMWRELAE